MSRAIDVASLLLILAGAALFILAYLGMIAVRDAPDVPFVPGTMEAYELTNKYLRFRRWSYAGLGLIVAGVAVGLSAAVHAYKIARRENDPSSLPEQMHVQEHQNAGELRAPGDG
jgi:hypothetical protein